MPTPPIKRRRATASRNPIPFLPEEWQEFLARRVVDGVAGLIFVTGAVLCLSILSYNPADPSLNTAAGLAARPSNWMGAPGSWIADLAMQVFGLGSLTVAALLMIWGGRLFRRYRLSPFPVRAAIAVFALFGLSAAAARVPSALIGIEGGAPYAGGGGGMLLLNQFASLLRPYASGYEHLAAAIACGVIGAALFAYASGLTRREWQAVSARVWTFVAGVSLFVYDAGVAAVRWVAYYGSRKPEFTAAEAAPVSRPRRNRTKAPRLSDSPGNEFLSDDDPAPPPARPIAAVRESAAPQIRIHTQKNPAERPAAAAKTQRILTLDNAATDWIFPPTDMLQPVPRDQMELKPDETMLRRNAEALQSVLRDFNVNGEIVSVNPGPVVTLYELEPAPGTKSSRVISLSDDIARSMSALSVRAAVVPGRNVIGIELPNRQRQTVYMREMLESRNWDKSNAKLPLILGKDIGGESIIADLARMPHLLVAGTTGSGKSVALNTMILSLLYRLSPDQCRFIMIDPKMLELSVYDDIPHLLSPVVTEPGKAVVALKWTVQEMENRYRAMSKVGVRNIEGYNARLREAQKKGETLMRKVQTGFDIETGKPVYEEQPIDLKELPYIVVVVDEFADLMLVAGKDVENAIQRLAQMARAAGIHLIMATQRPSVDVITGVIKANFPTRISFAVTSKIDSRTILGEGGAEQLLGMGDMLYMAAGGRITRVHGPFVADAEVEQVVEHLKAQGEPDYLEDVTEGGAEGGDVMNALFGGGEGSGDDLYDKAVAIVAAERKASTSFIQRHLQIGYNRAATLIERMEKEGVVGPANHVGKREVLVGDFSEF